MSQQSIGSLWLVGLSGSGKSTVGPLLGRLLQRPFVDTDLLLVRQEKRSIETIFAEHGERHFRRLESTLIRQLAARRRPLVVALGGGAFQTPANRAATRTNGMTIYLKAPVSVLYSRLSIHTDRPLLNVRPAKGESLKTARLRRLRQMLAKRSKNFERADLHVSTARKTPLQVAREIVRQLEAKNA